MGTTSTSTTLGSSPGQVARWDTPFASACFPAVLPYTNLEHDVELTLLVYPGGTGRYPAFVVRFESAPVIELAHEMSNSPIPGWQEAGGFNVKSCSYKWLDSPRIAHRGRVGSVAIIEDGHLPVQHFFIAGGDWIVQVLSTREPTIEVHEGPFSLCPSIDG